MPVTPLPTPVPSRNDPANFSARADAFLGALPTFAGQLNTLEVNVNQRETNATTQANAAETARALADTSASVASAAANFRGNWSSLTGALNIPATVAHQGYIWMLLSNVANITTSEPGVSSNWITVSAVTVADIGTAPNQLPLNQYLGSMAYEDLDNVSITGGVIDNVRIGISQPDPSAVNTTATLTTANLQAGIITSTTAAIVTATLPTGANMEGISTSTNSINASYNWTVINTGSNNFVVAQGASGHTVIGNMTVSGGTSANFRSRRTAASTWVTYRV